MHGRRGRQLLGRGGAVEERIGGVCVQLRRTSRSPLRVPAAALEIAEDDSSPRLRPSSARSSGGEAAGRSTSGPRPATARAPTRPRARRPRRELRRDPARRSPVAGGRAASPRRAPYSSGNGVSNARRSGTREPGSTSSTRSTDSEPAVARTWRSASVRLRRRSLPSWLSKPSLVGDRRAEGGGAEAELLDRRRQLGQLRRQRQPQAIAVGARLAQRHLAAPGALLDEAGPQSQLAKRSPVALRPRQQAIDQQRQHLVELKARRRLGQVEPLHQRLAQRRGDEAGCRGRAQARARRAPAGRSDRPARRRRARPARRAFARRAAPAPSAGRRCACSRPAAALAAARPAAAPGTRAPRRRARSARRGPDVPGSPPPWSRSGWRRRRCGWWSRSRGGHVRSLPRGCRRTAAAASRPRSTPPPAAPARRRRRSARAPTARTPRPWRRGRGRPRSAAGRGSATAPLPGASRDGSRAPRRCPKPPPPPARDPAAAPGPAAP